MVIVPQKRRGGQRPMDAWFDLKVEIEEEETEIDPYEPVVD